MEEQNELYWIWLAGRFAFASKEFARLADKFKTPFELYGLPNEEIERLDCVSAATRARLCDKELNRSYEILKYCKLNGIDIVGFHDDGYPERLRTIENPPVALYVKGTLPKLNLRLCIGMVGTRKMSEYGKRMAYKISYELAAADACVVSGMALGIDGVCACGAMEAGGQTVAVLGCGISKAYPKEHLELMEHIIKHGAVVSEYPPLTSPCKDYFPQRNRIISGLCQGTVVIEAARRSGALITARRAIAQGRGIFAVPGKIGEVGAGGPNDLIRDGASVALCAADIIKHYDFLYGDVINYKKYSAAQVHSEYRDGILERYGVTEAYYRGNYEAPDVSAQKTREPKGKKTSEPEQLHFDMQPKPESPASRAEPSPSVLDTLDETAKKLYSLLPSGREVRADELIAHGFAVGQVITSLTLLEIAGLVTSCPGGAFKKT